MSEIIITDEEFTLDVTPSIFEQWLVSYFMSRHPSSPPSVWHTFLGGTVHISYHAPPDGRITFEGMIPEPEKLRITKVRGYTGWDEYFSELITKIKERWGAVTPPYGFDSIVDDKNLAQNLTHRWGESERTFAAGAYLSTIVLLGSILEGMLLAKVQQNPRLANQAKCTPKNGGKPKPFVKWTLEELINVAHECKWLSGHTRDFSKYLQSYRNLVHPREQIKLDFYPDRETCNLARGVISAAIADLRHDIDRER
jgi:hypothetical protein